VRRRIIDARQPIKHALDGARLGVGAGLPLILKIYEEGIPSANVLPCASCHGPDGKGADAFPRLAGQLHDYIFRKLTNWKRPRDQLVAYIRSSPKLMGLLL
jgi:cytochrome c553